MPRSKRIGSWILLALLSYAGLGCAYGGAVAVNKGKTVIVTRNDHCLFGILRKVYACDVAKGGGLSNCRETTAP